MKQPHIQALRDIQHFGEEGGVVPSVDVSATSTFLNPTDMEKTFSGEMEGCYLYSRHSNPTVNMFGQKLAALEGMESALGVASGMSAIYCTLRQLMPKGGHLIASRTIYGGSYALFENILPQSGIKVSFVDTSDLQAVERAITQDTKVLYTESVSNPLLRVADLHALKSICTRHNLKFVVDNTFSPVLISTGPIGVDVTIYSCTKYISGASDMIAGAVVSSNEFISQLIDVNHGVVMLTGPTMDPHIAHELYLRLDHLPLRMKAHSESAAHLAQALYKQNLPVIYPGLTNHPDHQLMKSLAHPDFGFGGMVVFDCKTSARAYTLAGLLQKEKFGLYAVSLGFSRTLMSCPASSTSSEIPEDERNSMGLSAGLIRLSMGFTGDLETMTQRFLDCYKKLG